MSLRSFSQDTLQANWYEERCEPLQGVLPFDEKTSFVTINGQDFSDPSSLQAKKDMYKKTTHHPKMIRMDNYEQATVAARPLRDRPEYGFGAVLPTPNFHSNDRHLQTTSEHAYGHHAVVKACTQNVPHDQRAPAGGPGGARVERGKAASGASGEVIKSHDDPKKDTHAQRSWMYTKDSILTLKNYNPRHIDNNPSTETKMEAPRSDFRRHSTNITKVDLKKKGLFADDEED